MGDRYINDLLDDIDDILNDNDDSMETQPRSLEEFLEPFKSNEGHSNTVSTSSSSDENSTIRPHIHVSYSDQMPIESLQIVQEPFQSSKLRYRADYDREPRRAGSLSHKVKRTPLKGPAILIPQCYRQSSDQYYVRVSLVTVKHPQANIHYFHPYEFEHAKDGSCNDRRSNSVWFRIDPTDPIKHFPFLRIVKKRGIDVQGIASLRVFDCHPQTSFNNLTTEHPVRRYVDVLKEYSLDRSHLAFTIAEKKIINGEIWLTLYTNTTIYSEEMIENEEKQSDGDSNEEQPPCKFGNSVSKYAPKSSTCRSNDEMLIFLQKKIDLKKHGNLCIIFKCDIANDQWVHHVTNFDLQDRMISFRVPIFPYEISQSTPVNIILQQGDSLIDVLEYAYLPHKC